MFTGSFLNSLAVLSLFPAHLGVREGEEEEVTKAELPQCSYLSV